MTDLRQCLIKRVEFEMARSRRTVSFAGAELDVVLDALRGANALQTAAEKVCRFDWSSNDDDAVAAIDALRSALSTTTPAAAP